MTTTDFPTDDIDLSRFDETFTAAPKEGVEQSDVADGTYTVNVERVELTRSKASNNPMLAWELKILAPMHAGRRLWRHNVLVTDENIRWLKSDLHRCDVDLEKLSELPGRLDQLLDIKLKVTVRTKGEYTNAYINKRLSDEEAERAVTESQVSSF